MGCSHSSAIVPKKDTTVTRNSSKDAGAITDRPLLDQTGGDVSQVIIDYTSPRNKANAVTKAPITTLQQQQTVTTTGEPLSPTKAKNRVQVPKVTVFCTSQDGGREDALLHMFEYHGQPYEREGEPVPSAA